MRGKRSKQYRKLMNQYQLAFNFREPYQVLVDSEIVRDTTRMKMDLEGGLKRTLQGLVKPMITTCSMRHLYASNEQEAIGIAKTFERRRCNHHTLEEPLSELACIISVVDPKGSGTNKNRYIVATQELPIRSHLRGVLGVPLVYVKKSVMIMEPMAEKSGEERVKEERSKFRLGLKVRTGARSILGKRGREDEEQGQEIIGNPQSDGDSKEARKGKGPKGPNPLSIKKPKRRDNETRTKSIHQERGHSDQEADDAEGQAEKRKRRRKSSKRIDQEAGGVSVATVEAD